MFQYSNLRRRATPERYVRGKLSYAFALLQHCSRRAFYVTPSLSRARNRLQLVAGSALTVAESCIDSSLYRSESI
jgi:hypothetical protein